jgi:tRNA pseudouridine32 synthase / 23S rRNA pseudouridine746 synthase
MEHAVSEKIIFKAAVGTGFSGSVSDFLVLKTGLPKGRIKDAMNKGAVWLKKKNGRMNRSRKATASLGPGDQIELYFDPKLLSTKPLKAVCLSDLNHYSVWFKPAGMLAQGTQYGDHCSLMRQAELCFNSRRKVFLVHRIDREASGLMLIAHTKEAAAKLSYLFRNNLIIKKYRVEVLGNIREYSHSEINLPLDGKQSLTEFETDSYDQAKDISRVNVIIRTGRLHQIRRHFEMIGFPVIGDPEYGKGNKNKDGMMLSAVSLKFECPFLGHEVEYKGA